MSIPDMIGALVDDDKISAESAFKNAIAKKVGDVLDLKRIEVANSLVKHHVPQDADASEEV
ncbi:MAG: hypothetical protein CBC06_004350 [bacterium TMED46]|nr:MAG: hypothetical protein CBC06_004350 [bacterium TMED46]|tara:strand:+ start:2643 stop:2825 length:183 start_codon:yes stop_codon:yes gene_type:complete